MLELMEKNQKSLPEMTENLKMVTEKIQHFESVAKNSILAISMILSDVAKKPNEYLGTSFQTIAEYAECMFGYKKSYTYKLIKISKFVSINKWCSSIYSCKCSAYYFATDVVHYQH